jgi:hypothetical protein
MLGALLLSGCSSPRATGASAPKSTTSFQVAVPAAEHLTHAGMGMGMGKGIQGGNCLRSSYIVASSILTTQQLTHTFCLVHSPSSNQASQSGYHPSRVTSLHHPARHFTPTPLAPIWYPKERNTVTRLSNILLCTPILCHDCFNSGTRDQTGTARLLCESHD